MQYYFCNLLFSLKDSTVSSLHFLLDKYVRTSSTRFLSITRIEFLPLGNQYSILSSLIGKISLNLFNTSICRILRLLYSASKQRHAKFSWRCFEFFLTKDLNGVLESQIAIKNIIKDLFNGFNDFLNRFYYRIEYLFKFSIVHENHLFSAHSPI